MKKDKDILKRSTDRFYNGLEITITSVIDLVFKNLTPEKVRALKLNFALYLINKYKIPYIDKNKKKRGIFNRLVRI